MIFDSRSTRNFVSTSAAWYHGRGTNTFVVASSSVHLQHVILLSFQYGKKKERETTSRVCKRISGCWCRWRHPRDGSPLVSSYDAFVELTESIAAVIVRWSDGMWSNLIACHAIGRLWGEEKRFFFLLLILAISKILKSFEILLVRTETRPCNIRVRRTDLK